MQREATKRFYWPIILLAGFFLGIGGAGIHFLFYATNWMYSTPFAGFFTNLLPIFIFVPICFWAIYRLRKWDLYAGYGRLAFLQIAVHVVLISIIGAFFKASYNFIFYQFEPNFDKNIALYYKQQRQKLLNETTELKQKELILEQIHSIEKTIHYFEKNPPTPLSIFLQEIRNFLIFGFFYGIFFGFIFKNIGPISSNSPVSNS
ncbi:MAG: DUF4199 family protein [Bacteroidia bacterium]|nr:DUF4199 family protein [Bacteroidia bacterium]MDW8158281.1 DUF4199 family protein [Bacteroidia bacterium]